MVVVMAVAMLLLLVIVALVQAIPNLLYEAIKLVSRHSCSHCSPMNLPPPTTCTPWFWSWHSVSWPTMQPIGLGGTVPQHTRAMPIASGVVLVIEMGHIAHHHCMVF